MEVVSETCGVHWDAFKLLKVCDKSWNSGLVDVLSQFLHLLFLRLELLWRHVKLSCRFEDICIERILRRFFHELVQFFEVFHVLLPSILDDFGLLFFSQFFAFLWFRLWLPFLLKLLCEFLHMHLGIF